MRWKTGILTSTVLMAALLILFSVNDNFGEVIERPEITITGSSQLKLSERVVDGFALDGSWQGSGHAEIWLEGESGHKLAFDTRALESTGFFGRDTFALACMETCTLPATKTKNLDVKIEGEGVLRLDGYHYSTPQNAIGLALCPNCKRVSQNQEPDHSLLVIVLLLAISILGSHVLHHCCHDRKVKLSLIAVFTISFVVLLAMFGITITAPTSAVALTFRRSASVLAAFGVLAIFTIIAIEFTIRKRDIKPWEADQWDGK